MLTVCSTTKGYRSIQLKNAGNEPLELASLLVHISISYLQEDDEEYMSLTELRSRMCRQKAEHEELVKKKLLHRVWSSEERRDSLIAWLRMCHGRSDIGHVRCRTRARHSINWLKTGCRSSTANCT